MEGFSYDHWEFTRPTLLNMVTVFLTVPPSNGLQKARKCIFSLGTCLDDLSWPLVLKPDDEGVAL